MAGKLPQAHGELPTLNGWENYVTTIFFLRFTLLSFYTMAYLLLLGITITLAFCILLAG
jgi:hypothetical protein